VIFQPKVPAADGHNLLVRNGTIMDRVKVKIEDMEMLVRFVKLDAVNGGSADVIPQHVQSSWSEDWEERLDERRIVNAIEDVGLGQSQFGVDPSQSISVSRIQRFVSK
jgi:hypothetical protein